ncbi:MAG: hypothetical protein HFI12_06510 [Lachnospiraceae bacterium]|jgi:hypothetical protein|nr:hypothetical protein [Lachnospiraceae bacterium]
MKKIIIKGIVLILILFTLTGCSKQQRKAHDFYLPLDTSEFTLGEHPIPVTIGEVEVFVGETTLQTLLDADFPVVASEWNGSEVIEHEVDSTETLPAHTSFTDLSFWVTDSTFARLSVEAGSEDTKMGDAIISRLELHLSHRVDTLPDTILLNNVPVPEITRSKAGRMFPYFEQSNLSISLQGANYNCHLLFSPKTFVIYQFSLQKTSLNTSE